MDGALEMPALPGHRGNDIRKYIFQYYSNIKINLECTGQK